VGGIPLKHSQKRGQIGNWGGGGNPQDVEGRSEGEDRRHLFALSLMKKPGERIRGKGEKKKAKNPGGRN